jgi:hypothetical protein
LSTHHTGRFTVTNAAASTSYTVNTKALSCNCERGVTKQACRHLLFVLDQNPHELLAATQRLKKLYADVAGGLQRANRDFYHLTPAQEAAEWQRMEAERAAAAARGPSSPMGDDDGWGGGDDNPCMDDDDCSPTLTSTTSSSSSGSSSATTTTAASSSSSSSSSGSSSSSNPEPVVSPLKWDGKVISRSDFIDEPSPATFKSMKRLVTAADRNFVLCESAVWGLGGGQPAVRWEGIHKGVDTH